jgi:hypothetical protein
VPAIVIDVWQIRRDESHGGLAPGVKPVGEDNVSAQRDLRVGLGDRAGKS